MPNLPDRAHGGDYERLVEAVGDGVYVLGSDSTFHDINESLVEMSGYDRAEILETGPWLWHDDADIERFEAALGRLLTDDEASVATVEATLETADGEAIAIEVTLTLLPTENREYRGHVGVVRDVTARKEREKDLREYATTIRAMPDEVYTLDTKGRFTSVVTPAGSPVATSGYTPDELVGEHVSKVMDEADVETGREVIKGLLTTEDRERDSFEMAVVTKDGQRIPHENHVALLPDEDNHAFRGSVGVLRNIADRKARERRLQRQNERLEEFANVVSHDLRNPLNVAAGYLELVREDYDDDRLDRLADAHERMATIVEDVLALAREGEHVEDPEPVAIGDVARQAWGTVGRSAATLGATGDPEFLADGVRLQRLLENLFRNALEHAGPTVTVTVGAIEQPGETGFFVEDDGPGIPEDERESVFESGFSTASGGTGLGLAIVRRIADAHGWGVTVTESDTGGARFEFTGVDPA
jgi:PAS domain S-box-containing protein